jgi:hypothetical protein
VGAVNNNLAWKIKNARGDLNFWEKRTFCAFVSFEIYIKEIS